MMEMKWLVKDLDTDGETICDTEKSACEIAARKVGNTARTRLPLAGDTVYAYGPGDGTTSVMVRLVPVEWTRPQIRSQSNVL